MKHIKQQKFLQLAETLMVVGGSYALFSVPGLLPTSVLYMVMNSQLSNKYHRDMLETTGSSKIFKYSGLWLLKSLMKVRQFESKRPAIDNELKAFVAWSLPDEDWQLMLHKKLCKKFGKTQVEIFEYVEQNYSKVEIEEAFSDFFSRSDYVSSFTNNVLSLSVIETNIQLPRYVLDSAELADIETKLTGRLFNLHFMKRIIVEQPTEGILKLFSKLVEGRKGLPTPFAEDYPIADMLKAFDDAVKEKELLKDIKVSNINKKINKL